MTDQSKDPIPLFDIAEHEAAFFAAIVESADDAILSKRLDGTITSWNRGAEELYGYSAAETIGRNVRMLVPPGRPEEISQVLARIRSGEKVEHFDTVRRHKDGTIIDVSLTISPVRDAEGTVIGASTIARDIRDRKLAAERLAEYTREVERSNRDLERFAYVVSHDLAEPLRMISSFVQLIDEEFGDALDDRGREYVGFVLDGSRRMRTLIDDLLEYSRIGAEDLAFERVDLREVATRVLAVLQPAIDEAAADVVVADLPELTADTIKVELVLRNLVGNAVKFRREDEPPRVTVAAERSGDAWRVTVADNGIGVDERHSERVFEMFQRLHTRDRFPGTGVGLAICRRIVELHGGRIWLEPNAPHGTRFHFTLPDRDAPGARVVHVLVVEDNPGDVLLMKQGLAAWDQAVEVHHASNGEAALELLRRQGRHADAPRPDLVILDVNLPRLGGGEVLARMRGDPALASIPVAVMSSSSYEAGITAAYDSLTTCFVAKPMDVPDYRAAVRAIERFWMTATEQVGRGS